MNRLIFAAFVGLLVPLACSPTSENGDAGGDTAQMAKDTGSETSTDTDGEDGGDVESDTSDGCTIQADCADDEYCHEETCKAAPSC
jgi:hypothetical protein